MEGEQDSAGPRAPSGQKAYWRSASWSASRSLALETECSQEMNLAGTGSGQPPRYPAVPLTPRSLAKARSCIRPLQPLAITRRNLDDWPRPSSDDLGEWPNPLTPGAKPSSTHMPGEGLKLDLSSLRSQGKKDQMALFDKECSKVADHIYLGGDSVARNREILRQNGITHVLNCVGFVCPEYFKSDLIYRTLWLQDSPTEDITSILYDVFDYFEDVREQGGRVLVHCCQGVSRSTSLVIAYLMWRDGQSFDDAFQFVKAARGIANPNMGFACQLLQCQKRVHAIPLSPNSLLRMYRMAPHSPYDPLHLVPKMLNEPSPSALDSRGAFIIHVVSSIFVWVGQDCHHVMEKDAKAAAFQVVRYEKVQGPFTVIKEREEPSEFWEAFSSVSSSNSEVDPKLPKERTGFSVGVVAGKRSVESYNSDFELFYKAITGGVVPPSSSSPGQETQLPSRESNWSLLRRKFFPGSVIRYCPDPSLMGHIDPRFNRVQLLSGEHSTPPASFSPCSISSDSSISSKSSSNSPSMSPSTSSPPSLVPSPASHDLQSPVVPMSRSPLSSGEPLKRSQEKCSIAERRGSFRLPKLPTMNNDNDPSLLCQKVPKNFLGTAAEAVYLNSPRMASDPDLDSANNARTPAPQNCLSGSDYGDGSYRSEKDLDSQACRSSQNNCLDNSSRKKSVDLGLEVPSIVQPSVYCWPNTEKLTRFAEEDLNSKAVFVIISPCDGSSSEDAPRIAYVWVGSDVHITEMKPELKISEATDAVDWRLVACDFIESLGLGEDLPVKVLEEHETGTLLRSLVSR